jgi:hypothetical protein
VTTASSASRERGAAALVRLVADAGGAPVLRDQGPIGRLGTAKPMEASSDQHRVTVTYGPGRGPRHHARTP